MSKLYSGNRDDIALSKLPKGTKFVKAGYIEKPLKGQWYLSGAKPAAYRAANNLSTTHVILYPVQPSRVPGYAPTIIGPA
jgi:hypothetical protein